MRKFLVGGRAPSASLASLALVACLTVAGCRAAQDALSVKPKSLRDVPAARLAFRFEPDVKEESLPEYLKKEEAEEPLAGVKADFETRRGNTEALIRTVLSPTGQRALAIYGTSETDTDFRIDLYGAEGNFVRNILPQDLTGVFPSEVAWSPDGQRIVFSGIRNPSAQATPTPADALPPADPAAGPPASDPSVELTPTPAIPIIPSAQTFKTEQIYVGNSDGFDLRPVTTREGLIYFQLAWSPDGQLLAALACREDEWESRKRQGLAPAGRPRIVTLEGQERLLDDRLSVVAPVWSPDGSKVATAFDFDVAVYDVLGGAPTAASLPLAEALRGPSAEYDARVFKKDKGDAGKTGGASDKANAAPDASPAATPAAQAQPGEDVIISYNPFVRLEWPEPETLLAQTAYVRFFRDEPPVFSYQRWHAVRLSPQAALLE